MADPTPIPVITHGFSWAAVGSVGTFLTIAGGILTLIIKQIGPWRKQTTEAEQRLREELERRVEKLEKALEHKDAIHAAERALDRHKIANLTQCFDSVMLMLEAAPEKTAEIILRVKEMRAGQIRAEAIEKAAIYAADITASRETPV